MSFSATDLQKALSEVNADALFKVDFKDYYDETYNSSTPLLNRIQKTDSFTGKRMEFPIPIGYMGSVGSGSIPEANVADYGTCQITSKRIYAVSRVDREAIYEAMSDKGAFVKMLAEAAKKTVEADTWNFSRMLFNDGTGKLGTLKASGAVTDNGSGNYSVIVSDATWKEANWEENMFVNVGSTTDLFEITTVTPSTKTIIIQRQAGGTVVPVNSDAIYLQGSKDNDIFGIKGALEATSSTYYNVTVGRRWQAVNTDISYGAAIGPDIMNKTMIAVEKQCGKVPNLIVTSYTQYEKLLNQMESQKRYSLTSSPAKGLKTQMSFSGIQFMSNRGPIDVFPDRFCEDDRMYFLNTDYITLYRRPGHGWVKDDIGGNGYLRVIGEDEFEARHATYCQLFVALPFHGVVAGLTT